MIPTNIQTKKKPFCSTGSSHDPSNRGSEFDSRCSEASEFGIGIGASFGNDRCTAGNPNFLRNKVQLHRKSWTEKIKEFRRRRSEQRPTQRRRRYSFSFSSTAENVFERKFLLLLLLSSPSLSSSSSSSSSLLASSSTSTSVFLVLRRRLSRERRKARQSVVLVQTLKSPFVFFWGRPTSQRWQFFNRNRA